MSILDIFRSKRAPQENHQMVTDALDEIIRRVTEQSGIPRCIRFENNDHAAAFSGSQEDFALCLTLSSKRSGGWDYLIADLDSEHHWCEWEFEDRFEFFDTIVDHIAKRMNQKVKTVTEMTRRQGIRIAEYILDEQGGWQLISDDQANSRLVGMFISKNETKEIVKEYHI